MQVLKGVCFDSPVDYVNFMPFVPFVYPFYAPCMSFVYPLHAPQMPHAPYMLLICPVYALNSPVDDVACMPLFIPLVCSLHALCMLLMPLMPPVDPLNDICMPHLCLDSPDDDVACMSLLCPLYAPQIPHIRPTSCTHQ